MYRYGRSSNQAGFRSPTPLTNDEIARYAPSVLASDAHESRGDPERYILAESAAELRWGRDDQGDLAMPIHSVQHLLTPHRSADARSDLWSTFNVVQENLVKGGLTGRAANGRQQRTRPVQGIDQNVRLNRALWLLADGLRQLKD